MRPTIPAVVALVCLPLSMAHAQVPTDVPANHWARNAVVAVVGRGVMLAPGGRFNGSRLVTRTELIVSLASLARTLEQGRWPKTGAPTVRTPPKSGGWEKATVSRYELAALMDHAARYVATGLPKRTGKTYLASEALPPPVKVRLAAGHPAYASLSYLAKNRMIWPDSVLLKPGTQPVTGVQAVDALAQMLAGLNDRLTDEPQNREEMGFPPDHRH